MHVHKQYAINWNYILPLCLSENQGDLQESINIYNDKISE